jgi:hypothetical protein
MTIQQERATAFAEMLAEVGEPVVWKGKRLRRSFRMMR